MESKELSAQFEGPDLDLFAGTISMSNIKINSESSEKFEAEMAEFSVEGISLWHYLFNDSIAIDLIYIDSLEIMMSQSFSLPSDTTQKKKNPKAIGIDSIAVHHSNLTYLLKNGGLTVSNMSVESNGIFIAPQADPKISGIKVNLDSAYFILPDSLYQLTVKSLDYSLEKEKLTFTTSMETLNSKSGVAEKSGKEKDWMKIAPFNTEVTGLDIKQAILSKRLMARNITITGPEVEIYRDKRYADPSKEKQLPYQTFQALPLDVSIDSLQIQNGDVSYTERVENTTQPGTIHFKNMQVSLGNITNMEQVMDSTGRLAKMQAQADIMGASQLNVYWTFPLDSAAGPHTVYGRMGSMDLTKYNPMMMYTAYAQIKSGNQESLEFNFSYDSYNSSGTMSFAYTDLKIETYGDYPSEGGGLGSEIKSFLANTIIQNKNLPSNNSFRKGDIDYERNSQKSLFNYWWKSLLTGFKSSVGLSSQKKSND
jgi:hypothetical protein